MFRVAKAVIFLPLAIVDILQRAYLGFVGLFSNTLPILWWDRVNERIRSQTFKASHHSPKGRVDLTFYTPNRTCLRYARTLSTKEPDTLAWIDEFGGEGALFDIGANIGIFSLYYAKSHSGPVLAFEPSFFNLGLLAKNINANGLQDRISIVANPLSSSSQLNDFKLKSTVEGGAMSAFGVAHGYDGNPLMANHSYRTLGFSLDFMFQHGLLSTPPRMVKLDVDGIEHMILTGARKTLSRSDCKTVLIEVNDNFAGSREAVASLLGECGFEFRNQIKTALDKGETSRFAQMHNQVWVKSD